MSSEHTSKGIVGAEADRVCLRRPRAWIQAVAFNDGTELVLGRHEVVVFVGPNNVGKSAALRDIHGKLQHRGNGTVVIRDVRYGLEGEELDVVNWLNTVPVRGPNDPSHVDLPFGRLNRG